jgi:hypothetical protein
VEVSILMILNTVFVHVSYSNLIRDREILCTIPKLLIRKLYYVLFSLSIFIVQVTELVQSS